MLLVGFLFFCFNIFHEVFNIPYRFSTGRWNLVFAFFFFHISTTAGFTVENFLQFACLPGFPGFAPN